MSETTPIRKTNAIDEIAFVVQFEKDIDDKTLAQLMALKDELSSDLPYNEVINVFHTVFSAQGTGSSTSKPGGVVCAKKFEGEPSRFAWSVKIVSKNIVVTCSEYTNWKEVKEKALGFLAIVLKKLDLEENPVAEIVFQCVDKFIYTGTPEQYQMSNVFNVESASFLTPHATQAPPGGRPYPYAWHINQGWFSSHEDMQVLNNLSLNSQRKDDQSPHETTISHLVAIRKSDRTSIRDKELLSGNGQESGYLEKAMEVAHTSNKQVLLNLLNEDMSKDVGLKD